MSYADEFKTKQIKGKDISILFEEFKNKISGWFLEPEFDCTEVCNQYMITIEFVDGSEYSYYEEIKK